MLVLRPSYYECQGSEKIVTITVHISEGVRLTLGLPGGTLILPMKLNIMQELSNTGEYV